MIHGDGVCVTQGAYSERESDEKLAPCLVLIYNYFILDLVVGGSISSKSKENDKRREMSLWRVIGTS